MSDLQLPKKQPTKTVWKFASASFLNDLGADMVFSVWPIFLTSVLGASMSVVGIIDGIGEAMVSISQAASGYASDRMQKRKVFIWVGYLFGGLARIGYAISMSWPMVIPFRILDRSGKMRGSPRDAMVSDISVRENRGRHFGILRVMDNSGAVLGILLSFLLLKFLPFRTIFLLAAIPSFLAAVLILFSIRESEPKSNGLFRGIRLSDLSGNLRLMLLLTAIGELGMMSYSFLMLAAQDLGWSITLLPLLYLLFTVVAAITSYPLGKLSDTVGRKQLMYFGYSCWMGTCILLILDHSMLAIIMAFVLYGTSKATMDTVQKAFIAELAPPQFVGSTLGGFQLIIGLMSFPASLIAGLLWDQLGMTAAFIFGLSTVIIASLLLTGVRE